MTKLMAPSLSAVSKTIAEAGLQNTEEALPLEIMHNLRYQHGWRDLKLHQIICSQLLDVDPARKQALSSPAQLQSPTLISGLPPKSAYIHPDLLAHLVLNNMKETDVAIEREWILPASLGEKWSIRTLAGIFDCLPQRGVIAGAGSYRHQDNKRVLVGMLAHNGMGGDGTIVYYIMQEGEVKPRQN